MKQHEWEHSALTELRDGSVDQAIEAYRQRGRVIIGQNRDDTMGRAVEDWYRHVASTGDLTSGLLIAHDNDTVTELNQQARTHLAASNRLQGPTLEVGERTFQTGDRILCRKNQSRLGVFNGDLATVTNIDQERKSLPDPAGCSPTADTRPRPCRWPLTTTTERGNPISGITSSRFGDAAGCAISLRVVDDRCGFSNSCHSGCGTITACVRQNMDHGIAEATAETCQTLRSLRSTWGRLGTQTLSLGELRSQGWSLVLELQDDFDLP